MGVRGFFRERDSQNICIENISVSHGMIMLKINKATITRKLFKSDKDGYYFKLDKDKYYLKDAIMLNI